MRLLARTIREISHDKFDLCIDLSLEHRYSLFFKLMGIKQRIGFNYKQRGRFLTNRINLNGFEDKHVVEYHLELLKFLEIKPQFQKLELFLKQEEKNYAQAFLEKNGVLKDDLIIGIIPGGGASWGKKANYLQWPYENFAKICSELRKIPRTRIILFGSEADVGICQNIIKILQYTPIEAFGKTNLRQFIALIDKCNLIICNDTGPLHISAALGKKIVCLVGPVDEKVYGPYLPKADQVVIKKDLPCRPCYKKFRVPECNFGLRCLTAITAQEVVSEAERLLGIDKSTMII